MRYEKLLKSQQIGETLHSFVEDEEENYRKNPVESCQMAQRNNAN